VIHLDSGIVLESRRHGGRCYASADQAAVRIEKRLRRYKRRLKGHQAERSNGPLAAEADLDARSYVIVAPEQDTEEEATEFNPVIIAETTTALKRFSSARR